MHVSKKKHVKATINDVAEKAGVSIKTVSRVVNNERNVRPITRERVLKVVQALNYKPNTSARSLAADRSFLIALLYDNPSAIYVSDLQLGALAKCHDEGYFLLVEQCDSEGKDVGKKIKQLLTRSSLDGLILTPPLCDREELLEILNQNKMPYVRIAPNTRLEGGGYVYMDDYRAAYEMTSHLIALGHKKIAFIKGHPGHGSSALRYKGYCDALSTHQLFFDASFIEQGYFSYRSGMDCAERLLVKTNRPTAVFAADDDMAAGVEAVAHKLGIGIPQALSVVGFDDSAIARLIWPQLTTIRQPVVEMAEAAVRMLIERISCAKTGSEKKGPEKLLMEFEIIVRESSAPPITS